MIARAAPVGLLVGVDVALPVGLDDASDVGDAVAPADGETAGELWLAVGFDVQVKAHSKTKVERTASRDSSLTA